MTTSIPGPTGTFHFARSSRTWTWSEDLYAVYGFRPGDVVPTTELILSHQHPEDRAEVEQALLRTISTGEPHSLWHRICDAKGQVRQLVTFGAGHVGEDGSLEGVSGYVIDLSDAVRRTTARGVDEAIEQISESRPTIEQAKGALMATYRLGADDAFALLRAFSQNANVKLRDVARAVVEAVREGSMPEGGQGTWDELAAEIRSSS